MSKTETLSEFYQNKFNYLPENLQQDLGHFNVFRLEDYCKPDTQPIRYSRRDFYKVSLSNGHNIYHYAEKSMEINQPALVFFNPNVPYTVESKMDMSSVKGYFCIFREGFFSDNIRSNINSLPMFQRCGKPAYALTDQQYEQIAAIYEKMLLEINSDYQFKYDLIRSYLTEMIHAAMKIAPSEALYQHPDANSRITSVFTELLERQFPIESVSQRFSMRSAKDFAERLFVHVNHLNRAIKTTTGKTTTDLISERLLNEAKALLKHTNWNISEISYCLGFEEPAHFNNFFRKQVHIAPSLFRNS